MSPTDIHRLAFDVLCYLFHRMLPEDTARILAVLMGFRNSARLSSSTVVAIFDHILRKEDRIRVQQEEITSLYERVRELRTLEAPSQFFETAFRNLYASILQEREAARKVEERGNLLPSAAHPEEENEIGSPLAWFEPHPRAYDD